MSSVPILNSGFCRTLLFKHKPNNFGKVNQTTIFYFWQGTKHKTKQKQTKQQKIAITVIQAKVPMSNYSMESVLRSINLEGKNSTKQIMVKIDLIITQITIT